MSKQAIEFDRAKIMLKPITANRITANRVQWTIRFVLFTAVLSFLPPADTSFATPDFAEQTRQGCLACHETEEGGTLNDVGLSYLFSGHAWPPPEDGKAIWDMEKPLRSIFGYFHILALVAWFGTIIYVHLILKPGYASHGLPKSEVRLGVISMAVMGITGVVLTLTRVNSLSVLLETKWGILLSIKITFYLLLVLSAAFVVIYLKPRLLIKPAKTSRPEDGIFDPVALKEFNGKEGHPCYIAYKEKVYDVSGSAKWKGGIHFKHLAGADMTEAMKRAPHGEEKLEKMKIAGSYNSELVSEKTPAQKLFYFMAYLNLIVVFITLFVVALWRWGI